MSKNEFYMILNLILAKTFYTNLGVYKKQDRSNKCCDPRQ